MEISQNLLVNLFEEEKKQDKHNIEEKHSLQHMQQEIEQYFLTFCLPVETIKRFLRSHNQASPIKYKEGELDQRIRVANFCQHLPEIPVWSCALLEILWLDLFVFVSQLVTRLYLVGQCCAYDLSDVKLCDFLYSQLFYCT